MVAPRVWSLPLPLYPVPYCPGAQLMHPVAPERSENVPIGQGEQGSVNDSEKLPAVQELYVNSRVLLNHVWAPSMDRDSCTLPAGLAGGVHCT